MKFGTWFQPGNFFRDWRLGCKSDKPMKTSLFLFFLAASAPVFAQNWSIGAGTGPFVFGDFVRRTMRIGNEGGSELQTSTLSAATRAGLAVDLERSFSDRFAVRVEGAFTHAPLAVKASGNQEFSIDAGNIDITTLMVPLVFRINPRGTFRLHVMGGPAYAAYRITNRPNAAGTVPPFRGTRDDWGAALGAGVAWQWSERFAVEGQLTDIGTRSPFRRSDFSGLGATEIPYTHNIHTTIGVRYRF